jgi:hypothetical protein
MKNPGTELTTKIQKFHALVEVKNIFTYDSYFKKKLKILGQSKGKLLNVGCRWMSHHYSVLRVCKRTSVTTRYVKPA